MGFSRNFEAFGFVPAGPLVYDRLATNGDITDRIFASYLTDSEYQSFFSIGGYDEVGDNYDGDIYWLDVIEDFFWASPISEIVVEGSSIEMPSGFYGHFDTGTSAMFVDATYGKKLLNKIAGPIVRGIRFFGQWYFYSCDETKFPSFNLRIDGVYFEVTPATYLFDFRELGARSCSVLIYEVEADYWLIGDVFLRNYYSVWDQDNSKLGFAKGKYAPVVEPFY